MILHPKTIYLVLSTANNLGIVRLDDEDLAEAVEAVYLELEAMNEPQTMLPIENTEEPQSRGFLANMLNRMNEQQAEAYKDAREKPFIYPTRPEVPESVEEDQFAELIRVDDPLVEVHKRIDALEERLNAMEADS